MEAPDRQSLLRPSQSVRGAVSGLGDGPVESVTIVRNLLQRHPEYGGGLARKIELPESLGGASKPAEDWIQLVQDWLHDRSVTDEFLHGKLLIYGLSQLDEPLEEALQRSGFLKALAEELDGPALQVRVGESVDVSDEPGGRSTVRFVADTVARTDRLRRKPFAEYIASLLDNVWRDMAKEEAEDSSFVLHLDGRWGSGKTTLMRFMREAMQDRDRVDQRWVPIEFNAWRYQRTDPPWWALRQELYRQGLAVLWRQRRFPRVLWVFLAEWLWRLALPLRHVIAPLLVFLVIAWIILALIRAADPGDADVWLALGTVLRDYWSPIAAIIAVAWGVAATVGSGLTPGSQRGAKAFMEHRSDPLTILRRRFIGMVRQLGGRVAVFVDDLDRCRANSVVELLEGIQTLFRRRRVVYVVAGDRRWIESCYDQEYTDLAVHFQGDRRSIGSLFIEKAFQISADLPPTRDLDTLWSDLLAVGDARSSVDPAHATGEEAVGNRADGSEAPGETGAAEASAPGDVQVGEDGAGDGAADAPRVFETLRERIHSATTLGGISAALEDARREVPGRFQELVVEAVRRESAPELVADTTSLLAPFLPLLDPNPRAMKRYVNAFGIQVVALRLTDALHGLPIEEPWKQVALWTIVKMRWPDMADALRRHPEAVDAIRNRALETEDPVLKAYADDPEVQQVLAGRVEKADEEDTPLTSLAVRAIHVSTDARPLDPPPAATSEQ